MEGCFYGWMDGSVFIASFWLWNPNFRLKPRGCYSAPLNVLALFCFQILFKDKTAVGIEFANKQGKTNRVGAQREVILSAGALSSPQILMLSGVGPKKHLDEMKVGSFCYQSGYLSLGLMD
jgi:hypothetical protein